MNFAFFEEMYAYVWELIYKLFEIFGVEIKPVA